jgi:genome maintenance exonuclease 1
MDSFREKLQASQPSQVLLPKPKQFVYKNQSLELPDLEAQDRDFGRVYKIGNNLFYPSITTILSLLSKEAIDEWKMRIGKEEAEKISKTATVKGTAVHELCEKYLNNDLTNLSGYSYIQKDSFLRIKPVLDYHIDNIFLQETPLVSHKFKVAGRVDLIADFDGKLSIIDFKTAAKAKQKDWITAYFIQACFYALAMYEMYGILIEQIVIIITVEHDEPQIFVEHPKKYFNKFLEVRKQFNGEYGI